MGDRASTNRLLWVTEVDSGEQPKAFTHRRHEKLEGIWKRMRRWAVRQLGSERQTEEALQEATYKVARASHFSAIVEPHACVAKAVARSVTNILTRNEPVDFVCSADGVESVMGVPEKDWVKELDDRVFMEEFLAAMDEESRVICHKWLRGDD